MTSAHRVVALIALALMLYLGCTGSLIQGIDLYTLSTHAPDTDATLQSIHADDYGDEDYRVVTTADLTATPLPPGLDIPQALATVLKGMRHTDPAAQPDYVELRMAAGVPIGQLRQGRTLLAFDARSGAAVAPVPIGSTAVPASLRERTKALHRFWGQHAAPGVWIELCSGIAFLVVLLTGLVRYVQLLDDRWEEDQHGLFWHTPERGRDLHRWISVAAAVFLLSIALSGTWLGFEGVWQSLAPRRPAAARTPVSDYEAQEMAKITLAGLQAVAPESPIKVLRLREFGSMKQGVVITGGGETRQRVFNADTGLPASLTEPGYPPQSDYPFGRQVHDTIRRVHSGAMWGLTARAVDLLAGLALIYLSVSGMILYRTRPRA